METWRELVMTRPGQRVWLYAPEPLWKECFDLDSLPHEDVRWMIFEEVAVEFGLDTCNVQSTLYTHQGVRFFPATCKSSLALGKKMSPEDLFVEFQ